MKKLVLFFAAFASLIPTSRADEISEA